MRKIINEIKRFIVSRQINDVFNTRNEFSTIAIHDFSLNSSVLMFRKNVANHANTWQKSYNLLKLKKKSTIIKFRQKLTKFKITSIKSFYRIEFEFDDNEKNLISNDSNQINQNNINAIKRNDFSEINQKKNSNQQNTSNDTFRIESSNLQSIKRDRKKSKNFFVEINFVINSDFCFFMNYANKSINDYFNRLINDLNYFLIENSFRSFQFINLKQKKISHLLKKNNFQICQQTQCVIKHSCFQRTFRKWNQKWKYEKNIQKIAINNSNVQWFKKKSNFNSIINHLTNKLTFDFMHRRHDQKRFDQIIFLKHNANVRAINFHFQSKFLRQIVL